MIWQYPPKELPFTSDHYERLWAAAQIIEMPVGMLHISTGHSPGKGFRNERGMESYRRTINGRTQEIMDALFDIIFSGVLERFSALKLVVVENEVGWIPFWLQQSDRYFERYRFADPLTIKTRPSEYFHRRYTPCFSMIRLALLAFLHGELRTGCGRATTHIRIPLGHTRVMSSLGISDIYRSTRGQNSSKTTSQGFISWT